MEGISKLRWERETGHRLGLAVCFFLLAPPLSPQKTTHGKIRRGGIKKTKEGILLDAQHQGFPLLALTQSVGAPPPPTLPLSFLVCFLGEVVFFLWSFHWASRSFPPRIRCVCVRARDTQLRKRRAAVAQVGASGMPNPLTTAMFSPSESHSRLSSVAGFFLRPLVIILGWPCIGTGRFLGEGRGPLGRRERASVATSG